MSEPKRISFIEWLFVLGIAIFIDVTEFIVDLITFGVTEAIWPPIDMMIGGALAGYLWMRGQKLSNPKRLIPFLSVFGLEMMPLVQDLPLWSLDVIWNWFIAESPASVKKIAGADSNKKGKASDFSNKLQNLQFPSTQKTGGGFYGPVRNAPVGPVRGMTGGASPNAMSGDFAPPGGTPRMAIPQGVTGGGRALGAEAGAASGAAGVETAAARGIAGAETGMVAGAEAGAAAGPYGAIAGAVIGAVDEKEGTIAGKKLLGGKKHPLVTVKKQLNKVEEKLGPAGDLLKGNINQGGK